MLKSLPTICCSLLIVCFSHANANTANHENIVLKDVLPHIRFNQPDKVSPTFPADYFTKLQLKISALGDYDELKIEIVAHSDSSTLGAASKAKWGSNHGLSKLRANNVVKAIQAQLNLPNITYSAISKAASEPLFANDSAANKAKNRRAETNIIYQKPSNEVVDPVPSSFTAPASLNNNNNVEMRGSAGIEARTFFEDPAYPNQDRDSVSVSLNPKFYYAIPDSIDSISFNLHARIDSADERRSNTDVRELSYLKIGDGWEMKAGISKVFWGVTESQHLVDIVNQTDAIESIDGEEKLGQPMLNLTLLQWQDYGVFDVFVLPGFRERTFPGQDGRLRPGLAINTDNALYEASNDEKHVDAALRWAHSIDIFDIGLSHFWGTSRDPLIVATTAFNPITGTFVVTDLSPYYGIINQTGLDLQASLDGWLLKLEAISREGRQRQSRTTGLIESERYTALATGFEMTIVDFAERGIDLGLIAEWNYDDRKKQATTTFQNDLLLGTRWAMNDADSTEVLVGLVQDLDYDTTVLSLEGSTRLSSNLKLTIEGRVFAAVDDKDPTKVLDKDSFVQTQLDYFF